MTRLNKKRQVILLLLLLVLPTLQGAAEPELPVVTLKYDGSTGTEEDEEEGVLIPSSLKNGFSLKVREEFSEQVKADLLMVYVIKDYFEGAGDYSYYYLKPALYLALRERWNLDLSFRSKWHNYAYPDSRDLPKDYLALTPALTLAFKPVKGTKISAALKGDYGLYQNETKTRQAHAMSLRLSTLPAQGIPGFNRRMFSIESLLAGC